MATATTGVTATTADDVDRIRVLTISITAPQQGQRIGGRSLRAGVKRLEAAPTRVRGQDRDRPRRRLQLPVVLTEAVHRFPGTAHQEIEDDVGVRRSEPAQFGRQREGQQKVVGRDQTL